MTETLTRDSEVLHRALDRDGDTLRVSLARETIEFLTLALDSYLHGKQLFTVDEEVSPNEAAPLLGMSRPQVRKIMDLGFLDYRMVGTHYRIKTDSIRAFNEAERARSLAAMKEFSELQNELGLFD